MDRQDQDFNSSFTVKTYASSKVLDDDGRLVNQSVRLIPNSFDPSYADLILNEDDGGSYRVVGEFVRVVGNV
jgi:hypothetical protein